MNNKKDISNSIKIRIKIKMWEITNKDNNNCHKFE